jgi:hypothetical protein
MGRLVAVYVLFAAILAAAVGLAFYGYSYSSELTTRDRMVIMDTMREAAEKRLGIRTDHRDRQGCSMASIDIWSAGASCARDRPVRAWPPGRRSTIMPDGFMVSGRGAPAPPGTSPTQPAAHREFLETRVIPDLDLRRPTTGAACSELRWPALPVLDGKDPAGGPTCWSRPT